MGEVMAKPFSVETKESRFRLPLATRQQIKDLIEMEHEDARTVIIRAVAELWQREIGDASKHPAAEPHR
jgi:hypothetical protein